MRVHESCNSRSSLTGISRRLRAISSTLNWFTFWWELMRVFVTHAVISSQLSEGQLSSTLINSCSRCRGMRVEQLSCKLSLLNSHQLLFSLPGAWELKNSHVNSPFSTLINSCSRWPGAWELKNSHANSPFSTLINSHQLSSTLVLVDRGMRVENSHANSPFSTLTNSCSHCRGMIVEQLSCKLSLLNSHQLDLVLVDRGMRVEKLSCKLSLLNSHQLSPTLILVDRGMRVEKLSCKLSLLNSHQLDLVLVDRGIRVEKLSCKLSLLNSQQLSSTRSCSRWPGHKSWKLSCKLSLLNSQQLSSTLVLVDRGMRVEKLSCKLSLLNSHQLLFSFPGHESWKTLIQTGSPFSTLVNSHPRLTRAND